MAYTTIDDPEAYFQTVLYTGNGSANNAITLPGDTDMQPDLVWIKNRDQTDAHCVFDAVRGATKVLHSDTDGAEGTDTDTLDSFTSDGFQVDADVKVNTNTEKYVAWCWKANGSGSANSVGDISSTVSANTTSGISIVKYQGSGTGSDTVGHGGVQPDFITIKATSAASDWITTTKDIAGYIYISTNAALTSNATWLPLTSTTFELENTWGAYNTSGRDYIAYLFKSIQGFSKAGFYTGNNNNGDGPFIYTGFRPAFLMCKKTGGTADWIIVDSKRDTGNVTENYLHASASDAETTYSTNRVDLLSNGFKLKGNSEQFNVATTYIYMAFAEAPFVNSNGVPCNAR